MFSGHVVHSMDHIIYSSTIKDMSARLMLFIDVKNGLGITSRDIVNEFCMSPCAEKKGPSVVHNLVLDMVQQWS